MTQKKISELNAASTLAGTEVLPVVQSSATVKATVAQVLANLNATNLTSGTVPLARLSGITNTEIGASAAITYSKLSLSGSVVNSDVSASAAIAYSKLSLTGSIVDADVNASAAIALSKIALPSQTSNANKVLKTDGSAVSWGYPEECFTIAVSDETTDITTGTGKVTFRAPFAFTIPRIPRASLSTASSSGLPEVNIKVAGTTIFSTKLTIDATEKTSTTAATAAVLTTTPTTVSDDAEITIDIDTAGTGAKGLKVYLFYVRS
jgi:hypothetical protein